MNENINLCELLEGHEGETFYTPLCGDIIFNEFNFNYDNPIVTNRFCLSQEGKWNKEGEIMIFPSKDQRDWNKWAEEHKPKLPKTWSELIKAENVKTFGASTIENPYCSISIVASDKRRETIRETPIEKSALALLKIHQLIEVGYGGNITNEEWGNNIDKYSIVCINNEVKFMVNIAQKELISFHTQQQRNEFMSYFENVQLLKDYYMYDTDPD